MLDINTPELNKLTIKGNLLFDPTVEEITLTAKYIYIQSGKISAGN